MRGRLYITSLLSDRGLSNRFRNIKKVEKSRVLATFLEVYRRYLIHRRPLTALNERLACGCVAEGPSVHLLVKILIHY